MHQMHNSCIDSESNVWLCLSRMFHCMIVVPIQVQIQIVTSTHSYSEVIILLHFPLMKLNATIMQVEQE